MPGDTFSLMKPTVVVEDFTFSQQNGEEKRKKTKKSKKKY